MTALVVMGVSGSGKTTTGRSLAARLGWAFAEADEFHSTESIARMTSGVALTDEDRWPWLAAIASWITAQDSGAVVTCSALKRSYRDVLRGAGAVRFVALDVPPEVLRSRIVHRTGHWMPPSLLASQLADLEPLTPDEDGVTVSGELTPSQVVDRVLAWA